MTQPALQNPHRASTVHMSVPPSFPGSHREKHASTRAHVGGYPYRHTHDTHLTHLLLHREWGGPGRGRSPRGPVIEGCPPRSTRASPPPEGRAGVRIGDIATRNTSH